MASFWRKAPADVFAGMVRPCAVWPPPGAGDPLGPDMAIDGSTFIWTLRARNGSETLLRLELIVGRDCDDVVWVYEEVTEP